MYFHIIIYKLSKISKSSKIVNIKKIDNINKRYNYKNMTIILFSIQM